MPPPAPHLLGSQDLTRSCPPPPLALQQKPARLLDPLSNRHQPLLFEPPFSLPPTLKRSPGKGVDGGGGGETPARLRGSRMGSCVGGPKVWTVFKRCSTASFVPSKGVLGQLTSMGGSASPFRYPRTHIFGRTSTWGLPPFYCSPSPPLPASLTPSFLPLFFSFLSGSCTQLHEQEFHFLPNWDPLVVNVSLVGHHLQKRDTVLVVISNEDDVAACLSHEL